MECFCYLRNIQDLGRHPVRGGSEKHFKDQLFRLEPQWSITLFLPKTCRNYINFGPKVLPSKFLGYVLHAGRIWKRDILITDIEKLEQMDASEIHAKRLDAKEVLTPMNGEKVHIPHRRRNGKTNSLEKIRF